MAVSGGSSRSWARPGLEAGNMPAWKLEVLERKRAKMGSLPPAREGSPKRGRPQERGPTETLVLQDSLGPLHENPFIKLEKERRRRWGSQHSPGRSQQQTSPIRHLLDMYSNVPGIRTIRAENIIIIESDPGYFGRTSAEENTGSKHHRDPMEELLAKRGSKVTEIRASEVVIYEPDPSMKVNESVSLGQEDNAVLEEAGRVSRLLEKFDHGHSKPVRTRSWENLLDRDSQPSHRKPTMLPKPLIIERQSQAPVNKAAKRSGEISPSSSSFLDEDSKRFPLNNPSWLPSKPPTVHSIPDPGLFHKRPTSPVSPPAVVAPVSTTPLVVGPLSPHYETSTDEKSVSAVVASFIEKFEVGSSQNNLPLSKFLTGSQKTGRNTIVINPKATSWNSTRPETSGSQAKESLPLTNGHIDQSNVSAKADGSVKIEDLLSKSRRSRGYKVSEGSGQVPSTASVSSSEISLGAKSWGPKCEVDHARTIIPPESSATESGLCSSYNHCDPASSSATPNQQKRVSASTSTNDSFEIRPAPKPDLTNIGENDIQAKALANIRMQSKNSFVFVPKKRQAPSAPKHDTAMQSSINRPKVKNSASIYNGSKLDCTDAPYENGILSNGGESFSARGDISNPVERLEQTESQKASTVPALYDFDWKSGLLPAHSATEGHSFTDVGAELEYISSVQHDKRNDVLPVTNIHEGVIKSDIPITNIDDVVTNDVGELSQENKADVKGTDSSAPSYRPHASLSSVRNKVGNTFTVVPRRKPITEQEAFRTPIIEEEDDDESRSKRKPSDGNDAPYSELGALLKKRYPTVDEIQVIGGYLSLSKSCLSKNGSTRKKLKISFNEQNIHTMFEYPSETSLAEDDESAEESGSDSEDDQPSSPFLPRPTFVSSGTSTNTLRTNTTNSGLSSYTPKHSVEYSKWQEEPSKGGSASGDSTAPQEEMLTPADSNSLSDFRSEPALYF
ncbi:taperin [Pelobates fuscus]|uniref:taperin n=1 Tax=Pelobates fuscus TaxID=191477 RepID=UPI002FE4C6D8